MTPEPQDIIGIVKELQADMKRFEAAGYGEKILLADKLFASFPSIAQALLDREEKLKIAVEALEDAVPLIEGEYCSHSDDDGGEKCYARKQKDALQQIRSLPLT